MAELTVKQVKVIEYIKIAILDARYRSAAAGYEIKRFKITAPKEGSALAFLVVETGMKNNETIWASVFCRDRRHIMIGPNGGTELLNAKKKGRTINRGLRHVLYNSVD